MSWPKAEKGGVCAFVDAEHALDPLYARKLGVKPRRAADQPARHRRAGAGNRRYAGASGAVSVIVVDSVAALTPKPRSKGDGATIRSAQARLMSQAMQADRQHRAVKPMVIFINQIRMKIGVMPATLKPPRRERPEILRLGPPDIRRTGAVGDDEVGGQRHQGQGGQEQGRAAFRQVEFDIMGKWRGFPRPARVDRSGRQGRRGREVGPWYWRRTHRSGPRER